MPTIYEMNEAGEHIRYVHHSLVVFYLDQANLNALQAKKEQVPGVMLSSSVISILFSALALEAYLNEIADKALDETELEEFEFCRGSFKRKKSQSALRSKFESLLQRQYSSKLPKDIGEDIDNLAELRNALAHYKLSKYATKLKVNVPKAPEGMVVVDFSAPTEVIEEPLVRKISAIAAVSGYNVVRKAIIFWGTLDGVDNAASGFEEIA